MKFLMSLLSSLVLFQITTAWAKAPKPEEIGASATAVRESLDAFEQSHTRPNLKRLQDSLAVFKDLIDSAGQSIENNEGGAATPEAVLAVEVVAQFGHDIALALFTVRSDMGDDVDKKIVSDFEDCLINQVTHPLFRLGITELRTRVDEKDNVDGKTSWSDVIRRGFRSIGYDFANVWWSQNKVTGKWYNWLMENYRREKLARTMPGIYNSLLEKMISEINRRYDGNLEYNRQNYIERLAGLFLWLSDRAVNIRAETNSAELYSVAFYQMIGLLLAQPMFDPLLNFLPDSYTSALEGGILLLGTSAAIMAIKFSTSSLGSTSHWVKFNQNVRKSMKAGLVESTERYLRRQFPTEYYPGQVPVWVRRRLWLHDTISKATTTIKGACQFLLTAKGLDKTSK